jgi:hypothetical protein
MYSWSETYKGPKRLAHVLPINMFYMGVKLGSHPKGRNLFEGIGEYTAESNIRTSERT